MCNSPSTSKAAARRLAQLVEEVPGGQRRNHLVLDHSRFREPSMQQPCCKNNPCEEALPLSLQKGH